MIAYFSNEFPCAVEPYVTDEIEELRNHDLEVIICSFKRPQNLHQNKTTLNSAEVLYLSPLRLKVLLRAFLVLFHPSLADILARILTWGKEGIGLRLRAFTHTWLGAYYALLLKDSNVVHIHVHHGYFGAWIAMVAARILGISYSMTLHGSDLLVHKVYLDIKLKNCKMCFTVSEFNRNHILEHYPEIPAEKVIVSRMGVDVPTLTSSLPSNHECLQILSVGRLHRVKDHAFLIRACQVLKDQGCQFICNIIGDGPEHGALTRMVQKFGLENEVKLLGHMPHEELDFFYENSDLIVLTSRSEGVPLVLMEAMARKKIVLGPAITGIPELVIHAKTGFLYSPGSLESFVQSVEMIRRSLPRLGSVQRTAREHVNRYFNREKNLAAFSELFMAQLQPLTEAQDAHPVLQ